MIVARLSTPSGPWNVAGSWENRDDEAGAGRLPDTLAHSPPPTAAQTATTMATSRNTRLTRGNNTGMPATGHQG